MLRDDVLRLGLVEAEAAVLGLERVSSGGEEVEQDVDVAQDFLHLRQNGSGTRVTNLRANFLGLVLDNFSDPQLDNYLCIIDCSSITCLNR